MIFNITKTGIIDGQPANQEAVSNVKIYMLERTRYQLAYNRSPEPNQVPRGKLKRAAERIHSYLESYHHFSAPYNKMYLSDDMLINYIKLASEIREKKPDDEFEEISSLIAYSLRRWRQELEATGELNQ